MDFKSIIAKKGLNLKEVDGQLRGALEGTFKSAETYSPDEARLKKINSMSLVSQTKDSVITAPLVASNIKVDRGEERFTLKALETFSKLYPNKPVLKDHDWSVRSIVGKVYDARVENEELVLDAYFLKTDGNMETVNNILGGVYSKLSVGFAADPNDMICSACLKSMFDFECEHQPGEILKDGSKVCLIYKDITDVYEVSLVAVPANEPCAIRETKTLTSLGTNVTLADESIETVVVASASGGGALDYSKGEESSPGDRIILDADTIRNSSIMEENQNPPVAEEVLETPAVVEETAPVVEEAEAPVVEEESAVEKKLDEVSASITKLFEKLEEVNLKCSDMQVLIKSLPAPVNMEGLEKKVEAIETQVSEVCKTLEANLHISTSGINELLQAAIQPPVQETKKKSWAEDYWGQEANDLGGQQ